MTLVFALMWFLQSIPLFLQLRSFGIDMGFKWLFAIGLLDALIYGGADAISCLGCCIPSSLCGRLCASAQRDGRRPAVDASLWEAVDEEAGMTAGVAGGVGLVSVVRTAVRRWLSKDVCDTKPKCSSILHVLQY